MKIANNNPDWLFIVWNDSIEIERLRIMNRTEHEANSEAESYVENQHPGKDWTLTEIDGSVDYKIFKAIPEL